MNIHCRACDKPMTCKELEIDEELCKKCLDAIREADEDE